MTFEHWVLIFGALGGLSGLGAFVTAVSTVRQTAKKNDLDVLRMTIDELREENKRMNLTIKELQAENVSLRNKVTELDAENEQLRKKLGMTPFRKALKGLATRDDVD